MKANFKADKTIKIDYEIDLPYYCKSKLSYYKIIDEKVAIKVEYWDERHYTIAMINAETAFNCSEKPCDKEEYDLAFQQVSTFINRINE